MRPYIRKILICVIPVLLAIWAILVGRFKLGVDLSGGTILVYEIDSRKVKKDEKGQSVLRDDAGLLAESLKKRIDPNDLYNIVIRPVGEGRVEIILPTGGPEQAELADKQWALLLEDLDQKVKQKYGEKFSVKNLQVPRGQLADLAERIQQTIAEGTWETRLYSTAAERKALAARAEGTVPSDKELREQLSRDVPGWADLNAARQEQAIKKEREKFRAKALEPLYQARSRALGDYDTLLSEALAKALAGKPASPFTWGSEAVLDKTTRKKIETETLAVLEPFKAESLAGLIKEVKNRVGSSTKYREIEFWFKTQAWNEMIDRLWEKEVEKILEKDVKSLAATEVTGWGKLSETEQAQNKDYRKIRKAIFDDRKERLHSVLPDGFDELVGRAVVKGDSIAQAFVDTLSPILGEPLLDPAGGKFVERKKVEDFVTQNYGPSLKSIQELIEASNKDTGRGRDLTVEEVQRIKELISKVGKLEFKILANSYDDSEAIKDAKDLIVASRTKLDDMAKRGDPPPAPSGIYELKKLARGAISKVTYSWVELGKQERLQLHLDNAAQSEPGRGQSWSKMADARASQVATELPIPGDTTSRNKFWLQGALFFSRECKDRNLPPAERAAKKFEYFVLARNPEIDPATGQPTSDIDGSYLASAGSTLGEGRPAVSFTFNAAGGRLFHTLTEKNIPSGQGDESTQIKRHLAIILDGLVVSAPTINSAIGTHGQISGNFTPAEVKALVDILRSGALPATLKTQPVSESTMGATLGRDTIRAGLLAIGLAFAAVVLFMLVYYRFAGLVASVALLANLVLTVGFMVAVQATFTLPGLAGLVLMLGMAVDANVLIYERLREERERGASLTLALRNGYDRAFPTIIDTHMSSIFTAIVLYVVGNDQLKGFGVTLTVGLIISLFTSLYMTRLLFDVWNHLGWLKKLSMFRLFSKPDIDFMAIRYYWFTATIILTLVGMGFFLGRGTRGLNIDFVGGTAYAGQLKEPKSVDDLRNLLSEERQIQLLRGGQKQGGPKVQETDPVENRYTISYPLPNGTWTEERVVALANRPKGDTKEEREQDVRERASVLPDASVEQIFSSKANAPPGLSRLFNVRTTEKEPDLVQATLDQLLQEQQGDKRESLLKKVTMTVKDENLDKRPPEVILSFKEPSTGTPYFASPSFVRTLINRHLVERDAFDIPKIKGQGKDERRLSVEERLRELQNQPGGFQIDLTGEDNPEEGRYTKMKLTFSPNSGSLTLPQDQVAKIRKALDKTAKEFRDRPQPERLETFDSQLAAETRLRAMYAILLSWGAILVYLWFRFGNWTFGLAAVLCLIHDLFFTLGIIAACHFLHGTAIGNALLIEDFKIDLTAVAALLTLVGYSVNDTIVVFDRIREVRGKNPELTAQMINDSVNQTLSRTILTSVVTWLVVLVLYIWGGPGVHLFAFVMVVGVVVGTYSSIYIASPLLLIFGEGARATRGRERGPTPAGGAPDVRIQPAQ